MPISGWTHEILKWGLLLKRENEGDKYSDNAVGKIDKLIQADERIVAASSAILVLQPLEV